MNKPTKYEYLHVLQGNYGQGWEDRTFRCRDVLWETFEQMARDLECSIDYLINEAMKQYARQRT